MNKLKEIVSEQQERGGNSKLIQNYSKLFFSLHEDISRNETRDWDKKKKYVLKSKITF